MELPGHLGVAMLVYAPIAATAIRRGRPSRAWLGLAVVLALASSPDVDLYLVGVPHRGITHTLLAAAVVAGVVALLAFLLDSRGPGSTGGAAKSGATVGGVAVLSHLLGDVITPMGVRPFLPLSDATYSLSLVYAADQPANFALLVAGVAVFATATTAAGAPAPASGNVERTRRLIRRTPERLGRGTPARLVRRLSRLGRS